MRVDYVNNSLLRGISNRDRGYNEDCEFSNVILSDLVFAEDVRALVNLAQKTVAEKFGVNLELEIELIGEW